MWLTLSRVLPETALQLGSEISKSRLVARPRNALNMQAIKHLSILQLADVFANCCAVRCAQLVLRDILVVTAPARPISHYAENLVAVTASASSLLSCVMPSSCCATE